MGTIQPRARGGSSLRDELKANRKDREQIRRQRVTIPKPAVSAAAGGVAGMNEVYAVDGTFRLLAGADASVGPQWGTVYDPFAGTPGAGSLFVETFGDVLLVPEGWYQIAMTASLWWPDEASAPDSVTLYIQGGDAASYNNESTFKTCPVLGGWGVMQVMSQGPAYMKAGRDIHVEARIRGSLPVTDSAGGHCAFSITKLG